MISEVVVASTSASSVHGSGGVVVYDSVTGSPLHTLKGSNGVPGGCSATPSSGEEGGVVAVAQSDKGVVHVYSWQKEQLHCKIILPQKLTAWCVSPCSAFCAGGTEDGRVFLWETRSGLLLASFDAHYRRINKLSFDAGARVLVSISDDAALNIWLVARLVDEDAQGQLPVPYATFTDHTLPIADVYVGLGAFPHARIYTAALDKTVKIWSVDPPSLLSTVEFPAALSALAVDSLERTLFAASKHELYRADLHATQPSLTWLSHSLKGNTTAAIKLGRDTSVNTAAFSVSANTLLVGCADGFVDCYDVRSQQHLKSLGNGKNSVVDVHSLVKPVDLGGVSSASAISANVTGSTAAAASALPPIMPLNTLKKTVGERDREDHTVQMRGGAKDCTEAFFDCLWDENEPVDHVVVTEKQPEKNNSNTTHMHKLQEELTESKAALEKANKINEDMFAAVSQLKKNQSVEAAAKRQKK
ncbi:hypothetical protein E3P77_00530 [Wallemia ichthyophaga]|nr:hypothetical protein E3P77_00530 [Wallemia ichthyophaga]